MYYYVSEESGKIIGTSARLKPFDFVSLSDLLYGLMLPSGNDAALCLAENVGTHMYLSSEEYKLKKKRQDYDDNRDHNLLNPEKLFYDEMNKLAEKVGMTLTNYANPHGLSNPNNTSCALDVCKLTLVGIQDPLFKRVMGTKKWTGIIERDHKEVEITWENTNKLLDKGYMGVKTGVTVPAGPCLSSYYEQNKLGIIVVALGCKALNDRFTDCHSLTEWAVKNYQYLIQVPPQFREKDPRTIL